MSAVALGLHVDTLSERLIGELVRPEDIDWNSARQAWNRAVDQQPAAVVHAATQEDVVAVIEFAREHGLRIAPQGTGHGAAAVGDLAGTILLKTERMRGIAVDPHTRTVRVEAGVIWQEVADAADAHDLAVLAGSAPDVGVVGYTLGGGMSWLARKHGLAAANVLAAEVVTADGRARHVDHDNDAELFWALRGGGGNFAAVTALSFSAVPLAEVYAGWLIWPMEETARVLRAWRDWVASVPDELTSCARLLHLPPLPEIPEPFRGRSLVAVEAVSCGEAREADGLLAGLRTLEPELDTFAPMRPRELGRLHLDPDHPAPAIGNGMLIDGLPDPVVDELVRTVGVGSGTPLLSVEIRHTGGALRNAPADAGAAGALAGEFAVFALGVPFDAAMGHAIAAAVDGIEETFTECRCGRYFNFTERRVNASALFPEATLERLRRVKAEYDPADLFRANHPIEPAPATPVKEGAHR
jgi:FAD/FMN-containing dehydrogenase